MPSFKTLWDNFPDADTVKATCVNKQSGGRSEPFDNYCAILLSECFIKSGISTDKCPPGYKCWSHSGAKHVILAQNLANWLSSSPPDGFKPKETIKSSNFQSTLSGRTGVIFFKDYWQRKGESQEGRSGDHIDLWNKSRITGASMIYRTIIEFFGLVSDLNKSKEVWFWEVS